MWPTRLPTRWLSLGSGSKQRGCRASGSLRSFLVCLVLLVYTPVVPCPPFLGGLEFTSWSPRWHWWLRLAQPAITLLLWGIAAGLQESFPLISFKTDACLLLSALMGYGRRVGDTLAAPHWDAWRCLQEDAALPCQHWSWRCFDNTFFCSTVERIQKNLLDQSFTQNIIEERVSKNPLIAFHKKQVADILSFLLINCHFEDLLVVRTSGEMLRLCSFAARRKMKRLNNHMMRKNCSLPRQSY